MLYLDVHGTELWNEQTMEFVTIPETRLQLEHSLLSISKWEEKYCKPFLTQQEKTVAETLDYIRCMTLNRNVDPLVYTALTSNDIQKVDEYLAAKNTATFFNEDKKTSRSSEQITSELVYYWMVSYNIPFECQKWNFNRLMTLIRICGVKNQPPNKKNMRDIYARNNKLNAQRRKARHTHG